MIWDIDVGATNVVLSVVATGDYSANGVVDSADYAVWRNSVGATGEGLAADGNGDEVVDTLDYDFWRSRFGNVIGAGSGSHAATTIPEPATGTLFLASAIFWLYRRQGS
jgi:hypothetical protein